jgi:HPt (histidine-containing phosphotransfer) domain-containing protein
MSGKIGLMNLHASSETEPPALDLANINEYIGDDTVLLQRMLRLIVQRGAADTAALRGALHACDWPAAKSQLHHLAPTLNMMGNAPTRALLSHVQSLVAEVQKATEKSETARLAGLALADRLAALHVAAERHIAAA